MWNDRYSAHGLSLAGRANFDPGTMAVMAVAGSAMSAAGTLAGGSAAELAGRMKQTSDQFQADQLRENAASEIGASQRTMLDTQAKTRALTNSVVARAAGSGINAGVGTPVDLVSGIAKTGTYHAAMDLFNGENKATGMENQAADLEYSGNAAKIGGDMAQSASYLSAAGTLASGVSSGAQTYAKFTYGSPTAKV